MAESVEQRIVDNILGSLRRTDVNGVDEGQPPIDPREKNLPWAWVDFEEAERTPHGTKHTQIELRCGVLVGYRASDEPKALRMARHIRAQGETALLTDDRRGLTNPQTEIQTHILGQSGEDLWAVEVPVTITFQHVRGNPYDEGVI